MKSILFAFSLLTANIAFAQTSAPFDNDHWVISGKMEKETYLGNDCIRLSEASIYLKDATFLNGIIEFDMTLPKNRCFPGIGFRLQDKENFEEVYLRPHQLGNPDAIQYTPVFNGQAAWQLYYGDGYSTAITYPLNEWVHIKLIIKDTQGEVYVGNTDKPSLVIHHLKREPKPGQISLENNYPALTRFANFRYTKTNEPALQGPFKADVAPKPGTILHWQISNPFDQKQLENSFSIPKELNSQLIWKTLPAENTGIVNVSQITRIGNGSNTVFAKITITSDRDQIKKFQFGFSDAVKLYLNNRLLYGGQDVFLSRDYRFLGTTGYFDEVYLNLKKGKNELWLAISEDFGGWGLQGMIPDQTGLTIKP
ncbi:hypothetical protein GCM10028806_07920 [Spirosoma terrae]|uniref:DUF1080 domain-containing protein n=1 Tax=Spirosoma terrae TaxID=1968276 RepID=A0A6L9L632_9BACT|nr:hypothetical protein [Spirosoma terrae]NDU96066.1 hypothetical protein [Spirosoma terrae]